MTLRRSLLRRLAHLRVRFPTPGEVVAHDWSHPFDVLRSKWVEVPSTRSGRVRSGSLLTFDDRDLLSEWTRYREDVTTGDQFSNRGWYHTLYSEALRGKSILDIGSGLGFDGVTFVQHGATVTFVDLVEENLEVIRRVCRLLDLTDVRFHLLEELGSLEKLEREFDVIMAMGSLHHAPYEVIRNEARILVDHLKIGGRWLQLAYPRSRWLREGQLPFQKWGERTDGPGTPWAEWYDLPKLLGMLAPARFDAVLVQEFHGGDFVWFDLILRGAGARDAGY